MENNSINGYDTMDLVDFKHQMLFKSKKTQ